MPYNQGDTYMREIWQDPKVKISAIFSGYNVNYVYLPLKFGTTLFLRETIIYSYHSISHFKISQTFG